MGWQKGGDVSETELKSLFPLGHALLFKNLSRIPSFFPSACRPRSLHISSAANFKITHGRAPMRDPLNPVRSLQLGFSGSPLISRASGQNQTSLHLEDLESG